MFRCHMPIIMFMTSQLTLVDPTTVRTAMPVRTKTDFETIQPIRFKLDPGYCPYRCAINTLIKLECGSNCLGEIDHYIHRA